MEARLKSLRKRLNDKLATLDHAKRRLSEEKDAVTKGKRDLKAATKGQEIIQHVAQQIQQKAHAKIASVVSDCLKAVFDEPYRFKINFERKRGRTEARLTFERAGHELNPASGAGGGVIDVAAFALRLACLMLARPARRRLLVLDEPFKNVHSPIYRERVRLMLETLSEKMGVQIVMSTGIEEFQIGKVVVVE